MVTARSAFIAAALLLLVPQRARADTPCADVMPPSTAPGPRRALIPDDLVRLRDIGPMEPSQQSHGLFTLSPDGRRVALQVRRADPVRNAYCLAMVVVDLATGKARVVDRGGDLIRVTLDFRGRAGFPTGSAEPITPRWSPDGKWIAFRRRDDGVVQLWRAQADGSGSAALTRSEDDVEDFRFAPDGGSVVYSVVSGMRPARAGLEEEGRSGFHFDDRFAPASGYLPWPAPPIARTIQVLDLPGRTQREASKEEAALLGSTGMQEGLWDTAESLAGTASITVPSGTFDAASGRLSVTLRGQTLTCPDPACAGASRPWWTRAGAVRFRRREGRANVSTAIYEWLPGSPKAHRLAATDDLLVQCVPDGDALLCLRESSTRPRRLERLDPASGRRETLFDPNPEFASLRLGRIERLYQRNSFGLESFADLVLPVEFKTGRRYPLVVVQYESRGFLRGGTGDDYPIQGFANRGFAVLSINKPRSVGQLPGTSYLEGDRINLKDFADRRSVLESVELAVRDAINRGVADPRRIGITGLSDGASTAGFALLHSKLFAAFAMSSCCWDTTMPMRVGPAAGRNFHYMGYPGLTDDSPAARQFWNRIAISPNAHRIRAPILLQLPEYELLSALQSYTALKEVRAPVDLYVFPGEYHVKWQPSHRLAIYERSIDWFDFWLNGMRYLGPEREAEVMRWEALRRDQPQPADLPQAGATPRR